MNLVTAFNSILTWCILPFCLLNNLTAQTFWTGPMKSFSKTDYADWTLSENQDCITANVYITRADNQGIFNIVLESEFERANRTSPVDTEWANGSIADGIQNLTFTTWVLSLDGSPTDDIGKNKVLHLISEDIYIDVIFTSWTAGGGGSGTGFGGGFSYIRSTSICPTDINQDGITNSSDFLAVLANYNQPCNFYCPTDFNCDGITNTNDFLRVLADYNQTCN